MPTQRYRRPGPESRIPPGPRGWLDRRPERAPLWSSVDLRDGNQALARPMDVKRKRAMFDLLVRIGFKDIEVGYPSAGEAEFDFVRHLVAEGVPDDVTIGVFTPAREDLIDRTFESIRGAENAVVHLCHATACLWREVVFRMTPSEVMSLARKSAEHMLRLADRSSGAVRFEYSPETFNVTEPEFALEIADMVAETLDARPERPLILNLPSTVETDGPDVFADQIEWMHRNLARRDGVILSVHPHNDRGTAVAAAEFALAAGADRVEGTLFGNGERTGNVCLVTLALNLFSRGVDPQLDLSDLPEVRRIVEECNEMPVHARHPYGGELVFTAFSGTHQDAISKGLRHLETQAAQAGRTPAEMPWDVPYLPIDPRDVGRDYEAVIRVNSQSGKGGIAHVLQTGWGLDLPVPLRVDLAREVQRVTNDTGEELTPEQIWDIFRTAYCAIPGRDAAGAEEEDPAAALLGWIQSRGVRAETEQIVHGIAGGRTGATNAAYASVRANGRQAWGAGLGATEGTAAARAVHAALYRLGAAEDRTAGKPSVEKLAAENPTAENPTAEKLTAGVSGRKGPR